MKPVTIALALTAIGSAILACADSIESGPVITASAVAGGDGQSALVGTTLARSLQVQVRSDEAAMAGADVLWEANSGALAITSTATDSDGVASARWTLGSAPGPVSVTATVRGAKGSPVVFNATALGWVTAYPDRAADNQEGEVGSTLPKQLQVQAFAAGAPAPGVTVVWSTTHGSVSPRLTVTDSAGRAAAYWVMPHAAGSGTAEAVVARTTGAPLVFRAQAQPGPAVEFHKTWGDGQAVPANFPEFGALRVAAADRFGNEVWLPNIVWSTVSGPVEVLSQSQGTVVGRVAPTGEPGSAVVRATVSGTLMVDFDLEVTPTVPLVVFDQLGRGFSSAQNGSMPAVDTIPAGSSMTWVWLIPEYNYNYDDQGVVSIGDPSFSGGPFSSIPGRFTAVFSAPGTYRYLDAYAETLGGTVVVR